jgi:DNA modification methylase
MSGHLFYGDNLDVLRLHIQDGSVDMVYLDPPFNSDATYNILFGAPDGEKAASQIQAFDDTWHWDTASAAALEETITEGGEVAETLLAFRKMIGPSSMLAYLAMMAPRLIELKRVLKPTGSIFLHCDPTASHYLKLLLDAVFGRANFRNEIIWRYGKMSNATHRFPRNHDVILSYSISDKAFFKPIKQADSEYKKRFERWVRDNKVHFREVKMSKDKLILLRAKRVKKELGRELQDDDVLFDFNTEFKTQDDVFYDISIVKGNAAERLGYPTQKPVALLRRLIEAGCPEGGVVLDPFCGCGTTIVAAEELHRDWIGIDITNLAVMLIKSRLAELGTSDYKTTGEPQSLADAKQLAKDDPYQFQFWVLGLIGARPAVEKKGADQGIDGRLYFYDGAEEPRQLIASVKAGKVSVQHVRDLRGVIDREGAEVGVLISLNEPTQPMRAEVASAGYYSSPYGKHPRLQLITAEELLEGKKLDLPPEAFLKLKAAAVESGQVLPDQMTLTVEDTD